MTRCSVLMRPELHMHTSFEGKVAGSDVPPWFLNRQLWLSTHSIGMARKAAEMYAANRGKWRSLTSTTKI